MSKSQTVRLTAMFTSFCLMLCCFTACSKQQETSYIETQYKTAKSDSELVYNSGGSFSVNLSAEEPVFSENISGENITVYGIGIRDDDIPDIDSESGILLYDDEFDAENITPSRVTRHSDRFMTVDFIDDAFDTVRPDFYIIVSECEISGEQVRSISAVSVRYPYFSLVSDTSVMAYESGTADVKLTLDRGTFNSDISESDIVFSGGFTGAVLNAVRLSGENTISLNFSYNRYNGLENGQITVKRNAIINSPSDSVVNIDLISPSVIVDNDNFEATENYAKVSISLADCSFSDNASADDFSVDNSNIKITRFDKMSANQGVIYLSYEMDSVSDAIDAVGSSMFVIGLNALNINRNVNFHVIPGMPSVYAFVTNLEEDGSDFIVSAQLEITGGTFGYLSASKLSFGGDYSKAAVISTDYQDSSAFIKFRIPKTSSVENADLYGTVALKSDTVISRWGSKKSVSAFPLSYNASEQSTDVNEVFAPGSEPVTDAEKLMRIFCDNYYYGKELFEFDDSNKKIYDSIVSDANIISPLEKSIYNKTIDARLPYNNPLVDSQRYAVRIFISDVSTLRTAVLSMKPYLDTVYEIDSKLLSVQDEEYYELIAERTAAIESIRTVVNTRIKGMSFSELFELVIGEYIGSKSSFSALTAYDGLCDSLTNWECRSTENKRNMRYYTCSVLSQAFEALCYAWQQESEDTPSFVDPFYKLCSFSKDNELTENVFASQKCNTIGREINFVRLNSGIISTAGELSVSEITQLQNLTADNITLKEELLETSFDINNVRYILCSDTPVNSTLSFSENADGCRAYTVSSKATVFDMTHNSVQNEFEYGRYSVIFGAEGELQIKVYRHISLYSTK